MLNRAIYQTYSSDKTSLGTPYINLINCYELCQYVALRSKYENFKPYLVFMDDISLIVKENNENKIDFRTNMLGFDENVFKIDFFNLIAYKKDIFKIKLFNAQGTGAFCLIEKLLNSGEVAGICTVAQVLKFYKAYFIPNYSISDFKSGHIFPILHSDAENFYLFDIPKDFNLEYATQFDENSEIFVVKKELFKEAFDHYFKCFTVDLNMPEVDKLESSFVEKISEISNNYHKEVQINETEKLYTGRNAIQKFISICENEDLKLDEILFLIRWIFTMLCRRRQLFYECIVNSPVESIKSNKHLLLPVVSESIKQWNTVRNICERRCQYKNYKMDKELAVYFKNILNADDELFDLLKSTI